jgi:hypothetical protein
VVEARGSYKFIVDNHLRKVTKMYIDRTKFTKHLMCDISTTITFYELYVSLFPFYSGGCSLIDKDV